MDLTVTFGLAFPFAGLSLLWHERDVHALKRCCSRMLDIYMLLLLPVGMGIEDFSTADQWAPLAKQTVAKAKKKAQRRQAAAGWRAQPLYDLAALASPLKLTV